MTNNIIRSDETDKLFAAFAKFQGEMKSVKMDSEVKVSTKTGGSYSFKYATLGALVDATKPHLSKNGLAVTQVLSGRTLSTILVHSSGQFIGAESALLFEPTDPQKYGSLISYVRRYAYASILGLVSDEDDDGNIANDNKFERTPANGAATIKGRAEGSLATTRQIQKINSLLNHVPALRLPEEKVAWVQQRFGITVKDLVELKNSEASEIIQYILDKRMEEAQKHQEPLDA